jgi:hypothetical protein
MASPFDGPARERSRREAEVTIDAALSGAVNQGGHRSAGLKRSADAETVVNWAGGTCRHVNAHQNAVTRDIHFELSDKAGKWGPNQTPAMPITRF